MKKNLVYVVEERPNPSTDFFVLPQFPSSDYEIVKCGFDDVPSFERIQGSEVVFVRYLPGSWREFIENHRASFRTVRYFMDDDLLDWKAASEMPWRYRYKLFRLATRHVRWLQAQSIPMWVSTPFLAEKYADWNPELVLPKPLALPKTTLKVFYHGTASHQAEIEWLLPVIRAVLEAHPQVVFEIVGGEAVYRQFKPLGRVQVIHPMSWEAYQHFIKQPGRTIGLVPMMDNAFNQARSYTKFFDITAAGAVGIYAKHSEVGRFAAHESDGLVLEMQPQQWVDSILWLLEHAGERERLLNAAQEKLMLDVS